VKPNKDIKFIIMVGHFGEKICIQTEVAIPFYCFHDNFNMAQQRKISRHICKLRT